MVISSRLSNLLGRNGRHTVHMGVVHDSAADSVSESIRQDVAYWLELICPLGKDLNLTHTLDINHSRPASKFDGVKLRTIVVGKRTGVEIRIRQPGDSRQWVCSLYSDEDIAVELFRRGRPNAMLFIEGKLMHDDRMASVMCSPYDADKSKQRRVVSIFRRQDRMVDKFQSVSKLAELAFHLNGLISRKSKLAMEDILEAVRATINGKVRQDVIPDIVHLLVDEGALEPEIIPPKEVFLLRGIYLDDLLAIHQEALKTAEIARLRGELVRHTKDRRQQVRLREDAQAKVNAIDSIIEGIDKQAEANNARYKELTGVDYVESK